ncbi:MAG: hypothetical protein V3S04_01025, partial [Candidatus Omnitrophota bacterium]
MLSIFVWAGLTIFVSGLLFVLISMFKLAEANKQYSSSDTRPSNAGTLQLKRTVKSLQERLEATKAALDEEKESFSALTSFLRDKEATISDKAKIAEEAKEELARSVDENARLEEMIASFKSELLDANDAIPAKIEEAKAPLMKEIDKLDEDILRIESEREGLQKESVVLRDSLALANDEASATERKFDLADEKRLVREVMIKELSRNCATAESDLKGVRGENAVFVQEIALLKKELEIFQENSKIKDSIIEEFIHKRELALKEHASTKEEGMLLKGRVTSLESELSAARVSMPDKINQAKAVLQKVIDILKEERTELLTQKLERD